MEDEQICGFFRRFIYTIDTSEIVHCVVMPLLNYAKSCIHTACCVFRVRFLVMIFRVLRILRLLSECLMVFRLLALETFLRDLRTHSRGGLCGMRAAAAPSNESKAKCAHEQISRVSVTLRTAFAYGPHNNVCTHFWLFFLIRISTYSLAESDAEMCVCCFAFQRHSTTKCADSYRFGLVWSNTLCTC